MDQHHSSNELLVTVGACAICAVVVVGGCFLFRNEVVDNPELGIMTYKYRWGTRAWLMVDSNRDGNIDSRHRLVPGLSTSSEELWEDRDFDGVFEIHVIMDGDAIGTLSLDKDQDGEYEVTLSGPDAVAEWNRIVGRQSCSVGISGTPGRRSSPTATSPI